MNKKKKISAEKWAAQASANEELTDEKLEGVSGGTDTTVVYPITVAFSNGQTLSSVSLALNSYGLDSDLIDSILSCMEEYCCDHHYKTNVDKTGTITITSAETWTVTWVEED